MTNPQTVPNFIFVGGAPRSGTTLLQNMLDSHPDIIGGPEFLHLPDIIQFRQSMRPSLEKGWLDEYCTRSEADAYIKQLVNNFLLPLAKNNTVSFLSEKTPGNIRIFSELAELFPDAVFLQIVRDPRAVVSSMLKVGRRAREKGVQTQPFTRNIIDAASYLKVCYSKGVEFQSRNHERLLTIKYEDLVTHPGRLTRQVCNFLNLPWDAEMLRPDKHEHTGEEAITNDIWYNSKEYKRQPSKTEIGKWKKKLSFTQKTILFYLFRDFKPLKSYGYPLDKEWGNSAASKFFFGAGCIFYIFLKMVKKIKAVWQTI